MRYLDFFVENFDKFYSSSYLFNLIVAIILFLGAIRLIFIMVNEYYFYKNNNWNFEQDTKNKIFNGESGLGENLSNKSKIYAYPLFFLGSIILSVYQFGKFLNFFNSCCS